ncbi:hypothetical protein VUR80DRAFT_9969 [Thermomyces stellatus]
MYRMMQAVPYPVILVAGEEPSTEYARYDLRFSLTCKPTGQYGVGSAMRILVGHGEESRGQRSLDKCQSAARRGFPACNGGKQRLMPSALVASLQRSAAGLAGTTCWVMYRSPQVWRQRYIPLPRTSAPNFDVARKTNPNPSHLALLVFPFPIISPQSPFSTPNSTIAHPFSSTEDTLRIHRRRGLNTSTTSSASLKLFSGTWILPVGVVPVPLSTSVVIATSFLRLPWQFAGQTSPQPGDFASKQLPG